MYQILKITLSLSFVASQSWGAPLSRGPAQDATARQEALASREIAPMAAATAAALPADLDGVIQSKIKNLSAPTKAEASNPIVQKKVKDYLVSLKIDKNMKVASDVLSRLFQSSTQFLLCADMEDWECLEKKPQVTPTVGFRQDTADDLGQPVMVNEPLKIESYFTQRWALRKLNQPENKLTVAQILADKITEYAQEGLYMAIYGIDDIEDSMKSVFESVQKKVQARVDTKAVIDVSEEGAPNSFLRTYDITVEGGVLKVDQFTMKEIDFSYVKPQDPARWAWGRPQWMDQLRSNIVDPSKLKLENKFEKDAAWIVKQPGGDRVIRAAFQYKDTPRMLEMINRDAVSNTEAGARIEFPLDAIMHNKFVVMKKQGKLSVWSGTANVARTCMGAEDNSNMSIFIDNTQVALTFLNEFKEMYTFDPSNSKLVEQAPSLITGRFHLMKRPNTKRYFRFSDGHELRVHFSPTDDGEHRAIIPMLYSARKGDMIRISMFGAGGIEIVRAIQTAAARGAKVQIVLDNVTGAQAQGWLKSKVGNLLDQNPYDAKATKNVEVRVSTWLNKGLNHHKTASLTRADGRAEVLIVGSQNWSGAGNDSNDENMVTIRHRTQSLKVGAAFNENFDRYLFPLAAKASVGTDGKIIKDEAAAVLRAAGQ